MPAASTALKPAPLRHYLISIGLMLTVTTVFGGYSLLVHSALSGTATLHPLVFALARDTIGTALLLAGLAFETRAHNAKLPAGAPPLALLPARPDVPQLMMCAVCGVWCSQAGSALALKYLDGVTMSLLQPLLPLVTAVASLVVGYEVWPCSSRATWAKALGLAIAVGGACWVSYASSTKGGAAGGSKNLGLGLLFVGVQIVGGGVYSIFQKPLLLAGHSPLFVAAHGYCLGWCLLVLCALSGCTEAADWDWTRGAAGAALYSGVLSSAFAYYALAVCVHLSGPLFAAAFFPFMPVATVVLNWASGGGLPDPREALGGLACAGGLGLFVLGKLREGGGVGGGREEEKDVGEGAGNDGEALLLPEEVEIQ